MAERKKTCSDDLHLKFSQKGQKSMKKFKIQKQLMVTKSVLKKDIRYNRLEKEKKPKKAIL